MRNKYILSIVLACLLCLFKLHAQDNHFRIDGTVDTRYNDSLVTLFTFTGDIVRTVDSTYVKNGHFSFEGPEYLYEKSLVTIGNYPDTVLFAEVYLEKGDIMIEMQPQSIVRSPLLDEYKAFQDSCDVIWRQFLMIKDDDLIEEAYKQFCSYRFEFKKKHLHNALGREIFMKDGYDYCDDPLFAELYEMLSDKDKSRWDVKHRYEYWEKQHKSLQMVGKQFIDFVLTDSLNEKKRISDYVGKHKLLFLDFWASWCGPCLAQEPQIARLYQEYKDKDFRVLGISLDTNRESWLSALKKKEKIWPELCILGKEDEKHIRDLYNITGIPLGILIDKSGKIVYVVDAHWQQLEALLKAYYKVND